MKKVIVLKRQYGSLKWYEFESFSEMLKDEVLRYLAEGDGYHGILDIYTDDKDLLSEKMVRKDWYVDDEGNPKDHVYWVPSEEIHAKHMLSYNCGSMHCYPLSELPEERKEAPVDHEILMYVTNKPWNLE